MPISSSSSAGARVKIAFLDRATLPPGTRFNPPAFPHELSSYETTDASQVAARIEDCEIVITNKVPLRRDVIASAARLKLIAVAATGTDVIDLEAARECGVRVCNIRNYAAHTVPEHTFALILALRRSIKAYHEAVARGRWLESGQFCFFDYPIRDLAGSTLGIIGDGVLGRAVADIAKAFGMRVLISAHKGAVETGARYTPFETVLETSDIITLHLPLRDSTRDLIGAPEFDRMARRPLLINTSRGGIVDEVALSDALRDGKIAGAGFDVVTTEPMLVTHPFTALMSRPDFILTPHVAWASAEATQALSDQLTENIEAFWRGEPRNLVA